MPPQPSTLISPRTIGLAVGALLLVIVGGVVLYLMGGFSSSLSPSSAENQPAAVALAIGDSTSAAFQTHTDTIPNFAQSPTVKSKQNGNWSDAATWTTGRVPSTNDVVLISHIVTYDSTTGNVDTIGIAQGGTLTFRTDLNTKLQAANILVMPKGTFQIGTRGNPLPANLLAEIIIKNKPIDTTKDGVGIYDPMQWGTSLVAIDGTVQIFGAVKSPTFVRLAKEPKKGETTLMLAEAPQGWQAGDKLVLADTHAVKPRSDITPQPEEFVVRSVNGTTVTLDRALASDHLGARDAAGTLTFLPHVGNVSRNIVVRSENPGGTRGHLAFLHRSVIDVEYALFKDLGRTKALADQDNTTVQNGIVTHIGANQIGRYAIHAHHLTGPEGLPANEPQYKIIGNAVDGSPKLGIAIHDSHYGLIQYNTIYKAVGSGIMTEDGMESFNTIADNFIISSTGSGLTIYDGKSHGRMIGHEGAGIWMRMGINNYIRNNVVADVLSAGYVVAIVGNTPNVQIPAYKGADPMEAGQFRTINPSKTPILEFTSNEAYGTTKGMEFWNFGINQFFTNKPNPEKSGPESRQENVIRDLKVWGVNEGVRITHPVNQTTFENLVVRGNYCASRTCVGSSAGVNEQNSQEGRNITFRNPDIQGMGVGIVIPLETTYLLDRADPAKPFTIEGGILKNVINITVPMIAAHDNFDTAAPRKVLIRNIKFGTYQNNPLKNIVMLSSVPKSSRFFIYNAIQKDEIKVESYNGDPNKNFQVYHLIQAPTFVVPKTGPNQSRLIKGSPEVGLTNAQNWAKYGIAIGGAVAPCADTKTYPEIVGFACPPGVTSLESAFPQSLADFTSWFSSNANLAAATLALDELSQDAEENQDDDDEAYSDYVGQYGDGTYIPESIVSTASPALVAPSTSATPQNSVTHGPESQPSNGAPPSVSKNPANQNPATQNPAPTTANTSQPGTAPQGTTSITLTRSLYYGYKGNEVVLLQRYLIGKGHLEAGNDTGYFGPLTRAAVRKFQCAQNIVCSGNESTTGWGRAGPKTRAALK